MPFFFFFLLVGRVGTNAIEPHPCQSKIGMQLTGFENGLLMKLVVAKDGLEGKSTGCGEVTGKQSTCGSLCG
jgi:hypothetical protein